MRHRSHPILHRNRGSQGHGHRSPPTGTVATPVPVEVPLRTVTESEPEPQAAAIPATVTTVTLFPVSTWVTVIPSVSQLVTLAFPAPNVVLPVPMLAAWPTVANRTTAPIAAARSPLRVCVARCRLPVRGGASSVRPSPRSSLAADDDVRARDACRADAGERECLGGACAGRQRRRLLAERRVGRAWSGQRHSDRLAAAVRSGLVQAVDRDGGRS